MEIDDRWLEKFSRQPAKAMLESKLALEDSYVLNSPMSFTDPTGYLEDADELPQERIDEVTVFGSTGSGLNLGGLPSARSLGKLPRGAIPNPPLPRRIDTSDFGRELPDNGCLNSGVRCVATATGVLARIVANSFSVPIVYGTISQTDQEREPAKLPKNAVICNFGCSLTSASGGIGIVFYIGLAGEVGTVILVDKESDLIHVFTYFGGGFGAGTPSVFAGVETGRQSATSINELTGLGYSVNGIAAWNVGITGQVTAPADRNENYAGSGAIAGSAGGVVGYGGGISGLGTWTTYRGTYRANQAPRSILEILERVDE